MSDRTFVSVLPSFEAAELFLLMAEEIRECAVFLMNPDGVITAWNKGAEEMKGYTAAEALGQRLDFLYTVELRERGWPEHNLNVARETGFFREENWRRRKDGSLFWANISITALHNAEGLLLGFSKITLDLTSHRLLERCEKEKAEINLVLQAAHAATWRWNTVEDTVTVADHFFALLAHPPAAPTMPFDAWLAFIDTEDRPTLRGELERVRREGPRSQLALHVRLRQYDGQCRWFYVRADWLQPHADESVLVGVCVDIEALKAAEKSRETLFRTLQDERNRFGYILDQLPSGVILAEMPTGKLTYQNRAAEHMLGRSLQRVDSYRDYDKYVFLNAAGARVQAVELPLARAILQEDIARTEELLYEHPNGSRLHYAVSAASISDSDGIKRLAVAVMHDISSLKQAQLSAATEKEQAQVTLSAITDGVITTNLDGTIALLNPVAERMTGWSQEEASGRSIDDVVHPFDDNRSDVPVTQLIRDCVDEGRTMEGLPHAMLSARGGQRFAIESAIAPIALQDGEVIGAVLVFHDVTEARRMIDQLGFEASHDALTGLLNRREFGVRLARTLERIRHAPDSGAALLYMDLDQFKIVNDTCGHAAGDDLLHMLSQVYRVHVRERDTLARIGGDEFALIVDHCTVAEALVVAEKIREATRNFRYVCNNRVFHLGVSIGLIPIDANAPSVEEALRQADHACYIAKETGRNRIHLHQDDDVALLLRRSDMDWVTRLNDAIASSQLQLYYQPIMPVDDRESGLHYEILLRLRNGRHDVIAPTEFLPAAERYDVMPSVDRWVLRTSLDWLQANPEHVAQLQMCTINLSRRTLADPTFQEYAVCLIDAMQVPPEKLCFEITENGAITHMQKTISFIQALASRGCRFSLDDFGTGMTSFSYLKQLPVDFIKIDGSFI
jgi:diguanylate cyclase (GGDEF)-like protein/PAS domain S-box-containing protein